MIDFIVNGRAGYGRSWVRTKKILTEKLNEKGVEYRFHFTEYKKHATVIAKELCAQGATDIVAIGGDGTVNEVLNGLDVEKVNFGIIPHGSGNDFVDSVAIPHKIRAALDVILAGKTKPTDFLVCDGIRGLNIIGTGIDVEILQRREKYKIFKGKLKYFISLVISLIKFRFYDFKLKEGENYNDKSAMIICCCNGKKFGGGIPICPIALADDQKMEFILVNKMNKAKMIGYLIKLMQGKLLEQPFCDHVSQDEVKAIFEKPVTIEIDGELYEDLKFDVHIEKGALKLYRP
jgi:YegS/Rv2252/BmrU family lipid kinase